ncbi:MAG: AAA family ATPase [Beijerinckiaceae bacterium]
MHLVAICKHNILLLTPPGVGKTFYMGSIARAIGTAFIPISTNFTSDRWRLSGLSSVFKYVKIGKLAKGLLECPTASPLFTFDELDKAPSISGDIVIDVLLSVLEPPSSAPIPRSVRPEAGSRQRLSRHGTNRLSADRQPPK